MRVMAVLLAALAAACGGGGEGGGPTGPAVASVSLSQASVTVRVGASVALSATARDGGGAQVGGRTVAWTSSNEAVARVSAQGIVTGVGPGNATITATVDGRSAQAQVVVTPMIVSVRVTAPVSSIEPGQTAQLTAVALDPAGAAVPNTAFTWTSSNQAVATVSATGVVTAVAPGAVTITAVADDIAGSLPLVIRPPGGGVLEVTSVGPATITPGATFTVTGSNFSSVPGENTVSIGGVFGTVTAVTPTTLTVIAPRTGLPCQPTGNLAVTVTSPFGSVTRQHQVRAATQRTLAVGEALLVTDEAQLGCNELVNGGRYVVSVANSSTNPASLAGLIVSGIAPTPSATPRAQAAATPPAPSRRAGSGRADLDVRRAHYAAEARIREFERRALAGVGRPRTPSRLPGASLRAAPVKLTVGARDTLKLVNLDAQNASCNNFTRVPARVVYVGDKAVVLESDDSPLAGTMDADYADIAKEYEQVMEPILRTYFGDPTVYDDQLDNNDRIIMLFTRSVNSFQGGSVLGYVLNCDFFPSSQVQGSNQAEVFYARVPTGNSGTGINDRTVWKSRIRATLIHEAKHIVSYAARFAYPDDVSLEENWLEEGSAMIAEELYGRTIWGTTWKGNATYAQTLRCELTSPLPGDCPPLTPRAIADHFAFLHLYSLGHETQSFLSPTSSLVQTYGSAWAFLRWTADHYASDEAAFFRALLLDPKRTGVENVEARTGRPFAELVAYFALAMATDDRLPFTPPPTAKYTFPSWNLPTIWQGMSEARGAPYVPQPFGVRSGSFGGYSSGVVSVAGASAAVFDLSGAGAASLLNLRSDTDGALPAGTPLRIVILRVA